jgi:multimeric flavodoxin WrbA
MPDQRQVIAINGSPRKKWNTAALLGRALEGAASQGAQTSMIHLYDLDFKGCRSCFACKRKSSYRDGRCAARDDLSPVLRQVMAAQAVFLGSPIYLADISGSMRSFLERLVFMNMAYDMNERFVREKGPSFGLIYTMNVSRERMEQLGYPVILQFHAQYLREMKGQVEYMYSCDTFQFDDYSQYHAPMFDPEHKKREREKQFPLDLDLAFQMGSRLAGFPSAL